MTPYERSGLRTCCTVRRVRKRKGLGLMIISSRNRKFSTVHTALRLGENRVPLTLIGFTPSSSPVDPGYLFHIDSLSGQCVH